MNNKKFSVFNPLTGLNICVDTEHERDNLMAQLAWGLFLTHTHNAPYSAITVNEDGTETWTSPTGESILSPAQIEAEIEAEIAAEIANWQAQQTQ